MSELNHSRIVEQMVRPAADQRAATIKATNLTKRFGQRISVNKLSFSVKAGELYALLGDNGAGKTTTINMLTTLLSPSSGEFSICGYDGIREAEKTKGMFGVVSQDIAIYQELTAYENLQFIADMYRMPRRQAAERIELLLNRAGLAQRAHDLAASFSGGMQRKLSIAIAILHEPRVLFMDEPTVGLDPASRRQIWESLMELRAHGVTILLTTHYLEEAELLADRIGIIRNGSLVIEGTIEELRRHIESIRSVAVTLSRAVPAEELQKKIDRFTAIPGARIYLDELRYNINFLQPKEVTLTAFLESVLQWLQQEKISYSRFSTSEPSLEEIFLAITGEKQEPEFTENRSRSEADF